MPVPIPEGVQVVRCNICLHLGGLLEFYRVWYPGCPGPEPVQNPWYECSECGSKDIEGVDA